MKISPLSTLFAAKAPWNPNFFGSNLAAWYDAADSRTITQSGGLVSQWNDKSGNGYHVSNATAATQPDYLATGFNGRPTLQVVGGDFLNRGTTALGRNVGGITCALVGLHPTGQTFTANANEIFISAAGNAALTRFSTSPNATAGATADRYAIAGRRLDGDSFASVSSTTDSLANRGNPWIRVAQRAYSDGVANHWTNGTQDMTNEVVGTQTAGNTSDTDSLRISIFSGANAMPTGTQLSEIVLTHSTMTTADRQKLEGYLTWKWGLSYALPNNHPYKWDTSLFGGTDLSGLDADAKTYITSVETADKQDLETGVRTAINAFVVGCKADGIWNAIEASAILAGARTLAGALQPLVGTAPTNFNFVSGDYNRATGLIGNGSTKYLNSNRAGNTEALNNQHMSVYVGTAATATNAYIGLGGDTGIYRNTTFNAIDVRSRNSSGGTTGSINSIGLMGISRSNASNFDARVDGNTVIINSASTTLNTQNTTVFARESGTSLLADARLAFYSIGEALDLALLDTRVTNLMNQINGAIP